MLYKILALLSIFFFILSILNPSFHPPWNSFISEYLAFLSLLFLLPLLIQNKTSIPKVSLFFISIIFIPLVQYSLGQIFYFDKVVLSIIYIISFWLAIVVGFNSSNRYKYSLDYFFLVIMSCGLISSLLAIAQWLNIEMSIDWVMPTHNRPFANMAQPNHLATFLLLSLMTCLFFYENKRINNKILLLFSLILLVAIAMTHSRTAWVALLFVYIYLAVSYRRKLLKFSFEKQSLFLAYFFTAAILLPVVKASGLKLENAVAVAQRSSSIHERIQIWRQGIAAIQHQPLWGYGWNQSSFAQYDTFQIGYATRYTTSFHNIFLDIVIWCGIPVGITIIIACVSLILKLLVKSVTTSQICLITSIIIILIHSLFEYPLSYSYFLLPLGFMLGVLFFTFEKKVVKVIGYYSILAFIIGLGLSIFIAREYSYIPDNMVAAETHEMNERKDSITFPYSFYFFDTFESRARWIGLYPCMRLDSNQIEEIRYMVKTYMIHYDLHKFSKVLYFNGYKNESQKHLDMLNYMYKEKLKLKDLQCESN